MNKRFFVLGLASILASPIWAQTASDETETVSEEEFVLEEVKVLGVRRRLEQSGVLTNAIMKTEMVSSVTIENLNAVNLSEAIRFSPGVRVSNECSMCGVKRIMLNGMKGEQTTILVDNLPVHTMISGYYAVDAIPTTGIDRIEVARGAGASLTAPEAIGGTINVITLEPEESGVGFDISVEPDGLKMLGGLGKYVSKSGDTRLTLVAQYDKHHQVDEDNNLVNEEPDQENKNFVLRLSQDIGLKNNITMRLGLVSSEVFGGPMLSEEFADGVASSPEAVISRYDGQHGNPWELFQNGDVQEPFIAKAWETTEWIDTKRDEFSFSWLSELSENWNMTLSTSYAKHTQDSFYEGFDYYAEDKMHYYDARFNVSIRDSHLLTFGADLRDEKMRSDSEQGSSNPNYTSDSFDYRVNALYFQDTWYVNDNLEALLVLRNDHVKADFIDPQKPGVEIDESIISPRMDLRFAHSDRWTSRLSAGRGWRAPLSFFETDHGILDGELGFLIDVDSLERSRSVTYALSFDGVRLTATGALAWTEVKNLATLDETEGGIPVLTQLDEKATVGVADISLGYQVRDDLTVNFTAETYNYDNVFKSSYAVAPVEERVAFNFDWKPGNWNLFANVVWFGSRDLTDYGYQGYNSSNENGVIEESLKSTKAPAFWVMDARLAYDLSDAVTVYVGASNLFDYRQVVDEETPLFYDEGANYDVGYIFAPLRGREVYLGLSGSF